MCGAIYAVQSTGRGGGGRRRRRRRRNAVHIVSAVRCGGPQAVPCVSSLRLSPGWRIHGSRLCGSRRGRLHANDQYFCYVYFFVRNDLFGHFSSILKVRKEREARGRAIGTIFGFWYFKKGPPPAELLLALRQGETLLAGAPFIDARSQKSYLWLGRVPFFPSEL